MTQTNARRLPMALVAAMALGVALAFAPAHAAPTQDDLAAAALTAREVGTGFTVAQKGLVDKLTAVGVTSYMVIYERVGRGGVDLVAVLLFDANAADDAGDLDASAELDQLQSLGITLAPATPPAIGSDTQLVTVSGSLLGMNIGGDAITWRHGSIGAMVAAFGTSSPTAQGYAEQQEAKLSALGN